MKVFKLAKKNKKNKIKTFNLIQDKILQQEQINQTTTKKSDLESTNKVKSVNKNKKINTKPKKDSMIRAWFKVFFDRSTVLFSGIVKEFSRVTWLKGRKLWEAYITVIVIAILFAVLFYVIITIAQRI
ncbi:Protein translocase subunit SecE [[Mycoplasma] cavipharyngis]|uniref:preprotein translocase subunit SecE n=1 Tax=[Mycoplasma] cavipharyngis TaxID=92757 RepID=UPI003703B631